MRIAAGILLVALAALAFSCDESLPPRRSPADFLKWELSMTGAGHPIEIRYEEPVHQQGALRIRVTNIYDEVLQDTAVLAGRLEIWVKGRPQARAILLLTISHLVTRKMLTGRLLTIGVDSTLEMFREWDHFTDSRIPVWQYARLYPDTTSGGALFCRSDPLTLVIRCSLRIFKSFGQIRLPDQEVTLTYHVFGYTCRPPA